MFLLLYNLIWCKIVGSNTLWFLLYKKFCENKPTYRWFKFLSFCWKAYSKGIFSLTHQTCGAITDNSLTRYHILFIRYFITSNRFLEKLIDLYFLLTTQLFVFFYKLKLYFAYLDFWDFFTYTISRNEIKIQNFVGVGGRIWFFFKISNRLKKKINFGKNEKGKSVGSRSINLYTVLKFQFFIFSSFGDLLYFKFNLIWYYFMRTMLSKSKN